MQAAFSTLLLLLAAGLNCATAAYPGALDRSFPAEPLPYAPSVCLAMQTDGKMLAGGDGFAVPWSAIRRGPLVRFNPDGSLDTSFNPPLIGNARTVKIDTKGSYIAGGSFAVPGFPSNTLIAKLLPDGRLDPSFAINEATAGELGSLVIQRDGKIVMGGVIFQVGGRTFQGVARVDSQGRLDPTFDPGAGVLPRAAGGRAYLIYAMDVDQQDRILVGGFIGTADGTPCPGIVRLLPNGRPDPSFQPPLLSDSVVRSLKVLENGSILVGGFLRRPNETNAVLRLTEDGSIDSSFFSPPQIVPSELYLEELEVQPDGKILVSGDPGLTTTALGSLVRLMPDGHVDSTFGMFALAPLNASLIEIELNPAGDIIAVGNWMEIYGVPTPWIIRFQGGDLPQIAPQISSAPTVVQAKAGALWNLSPVVGGNPAPTFQWYFEGQAMPGETRASLELRGTTSSNSGTYTLGASNALGSVTSTVAQVFAPSVSTEPGSSLADFVPSIPLGKIQAVVEQPGCGLLVAGSSLTRLRPDGSKDPNFHELTGTFGSFSALALTRTGSTLAGGLFQSVNGVARRTLVKLMPNGDLDPEFSALADVAISPRALAVDSQDRIYVAQVSLLGFSLIRLLGNGEPDKSFVPVNTTAGAINCLLVQSQDRLVVAGQFNGWSGSPAQNMVRLLPTGEVDAAFASTPGADGEILTVQATSDGKLLWGGRFQSFSGHPAKYLARTDANGILDTSLNASSALGHISQLSLTANGQILAGHDLSKFSGDGPKTLLSRYNQQGLLDSTFQLSLSSSSAVIRSGILTSCGEWVVAGNFNEIGGLARNGLSKIRLIGPVASSIVIRHQPNSMNIPAGQSAILGVIADGGALSYQWLVDKLPSPGQTLPTMFIRASTPGEVRDYQVVLSNRVGVITSAVARVTTLDPVPDFRLNPASQAVPEASNVKLTVGVNAGASTRLQWFHDGTPLRGETNQALLLAEVSQSDAGVYRVEASSNGGMAISKPARLTILPRVSLDEVLNTTAWNWSSSGDPSWVADLAHSFDADGSAGSGVIVPTGGATVLSAQVFGPGELTFRWKTSVHTKAHQLAFSPTGSAPFATLTGETGWEEVRVQIQNGFMTLKWLYEELAFEPQGFDRGWVDRVSFRPAISSPPVLLKAPTSTTWSEGGPLKLSAFAEGTLPLRYQWFRNGAAMPGATHANLWLDPVAADSAGMYTVRVVNEFGEAKSDDASIQFLTGPPRLSAPQWNRESLAFSFVLRGVPNQRYRIEHSIDLETWTPLKEILLSDPSMPVDAGSPTAATRHLYRAVAIDE